MFQRFSEGQTSGRVACPLSRAPTQSRARQRIHFVRYFSEIRDYLLSYMYGTSATIWFLGVLHFLDVYCNVSSSEKYPNTLQALFFYSVAKFFGAERNFGGDFWKETKSASCVLVFEINTCFIRAETKRRPSVNLFILIMIV